MADMWCAILNVYECLVCFKVLFVAYGFAIINGRRQGVFFLFFTFFFQVLVFLFSFVLSAELFYRNSSFLLFIFLFFCICFMFLFLNMID